MFNFNVFKNGVEISHQTMVQIFGAMMEDRDTLSVEDWMGRYSGYIMDTAKLINSMREDKLEEDDLLSFASHIAHMVYTKKYDDMVSDIDATDFNAFIKESQGKDIASS